MKFLYPQFLWALLALAVPLIIHLFNFRRFTTLYFSDTRLLKNLVKQSRAINRLRHLLIMLMRMLALAMLVLAFANPYLPAGNEGKGKIRYLSVYIDNSPSMTSGEFQSTKLSEVISRAADFIKALPAGYRVQVLSNDFSARQLEFFPPNDAIRLLDDIEASFSSRSFEEVMARIEAAASENDLSDQDVYLFSDFQKHAYEVKARTASNNELQLVRPSLEGPKANIAIDSAWFYQPVLQPGFDQSLKVRLHYSGDGLEQEVALSLAINGETQGVQKISIQPGMSKEAEFVFRLEQPADYQGTLSIDEAGPDFDNRLYFNFRVAEPFRVLLTGNKENLATMQRLFRDSIYKLNYTPESAIDYGELSSYDLIIADGVESLSSGFITAVRENLKQGKNLVLLPGNDDPEAINGLLASLGRPLLGEKQRGLRASSVSWNDPHFNQVFNSTPDNPALTKCSFYYQYTSTAGFPLIKLENGSPLVSRLTVDNGDIVLFTSSLDSSGLKRQPLIVPLMLNAALFSRENAALYTISGRAEGPSYPAPENDKVLSLRLPEGKLIPRQRRKGSQVELYELPSDIPAGTYEVMDQEKVVGMLSLNADPAESRWNFLNFEDINALYGIDEPSVLRADTAVFEEIIKRQYEGVSLWKWFLLGAVFFLLAEIVLIKLWN